MNGSINPLIKHLKIGLSTVDRFFPQVLWKVGFSFVLDLLQFDLN